MIFSLANFISLGHNFIVLFYFVSVTTEMPPSRKYAAEKKVELMDLAKEIEIRPIIWDVKNITHNRVALNECWNQIADVLNQPGKDCDGFVWL